MPVPAAQRWGMYARQQQVPNVNGVNLQTGREASLDPDHLQKRYTLLSPNFILNLVPSFPSNLSKYVDKTRHIYVTSLLETEEVS